MNESRINVNHILNEILNGLFCYIEISIGEILVKFNEFILWNNHYFTFSYIPIAVNASVAPRRRVLAALASGSSQANNSSRGISVAGGLPGPRLLLSPIPAPRLYAILSACLCLLCKVSIPSKISLSPAQYIRGVNSTSEHRNVQRLVEICNR